MNMTNLLKKLEEKPLEPLVMRLLAAWCITACFFFVYVGGDFTEIEKLTEIPLWLFVTIFGFNFVVITLVAVKRKRPSERRALPVAFAIYSVFSVYVLESYWYVFILTVFWAILLYYYEKRGFFRRPKKPFTEKSRKKALWIGMGAFLLVVGGIGMMRYLSYQAPNYDFGIFSQMFYNMSKTLLPVTTCERDELLSHFAVHISPIYYVLLPFYWIIPSPVTLQVAQAALLASAAIPLSRLCSRYQLRPWMNAGLCALLMLYPAVAGGTEYDFHENCFLLPLLLWVFCLFEEERWLPMSICAVLTLMVKEDAAVYLLFFAIYLILGRKKYGLGALMILGAGVYFLIALHLLQTVGDGVMEGRYSNYIAGDGGLLEAVKNVLVDPGYAFTQILVDKEGEYGGKLLFLLQMFAPLAFLPFCVKKVSRLLLLLPMLLLNLLTVYPYQYDICYQYSFGVTAFVFYLCVLNLSELPPAFGKRFLCIALACGTLCFFAGPAVNFVKFNVKYFGCKEEISLLQETITAIPKDAKVSASAYFTCHLSKRDTLYEVYYHEPKEGEVLDYVLLDMRYDYDRFVPQYEEWGYEVTKSVKTKDGREILVMLEPAGRNTANTAG